ncbi:MAG: hypothetical protein AAGG80_02865 [Pseudomonadota bacterium]
MKKLVLYPTTVSQWHALVNEAQQSCQLELGEDLESYLVFLLMRFSEKPEFIKSVFALEFLDSINQSGRQQHYKLQTLGDKCLLFAGLFPEQAARKRVTYNYFIDLGQNAYYMLANLSEIELASLFNALCESFTHVRDVLGAMRNQNLQQIFAPEVISLIEKNSIH